MVLNSGKRISLLIVLFAHLNYANNGSELTIGFVGDVMLGRLLVKCCLKILIIHIHGEIYCRY